MLKRFLDLVGAMIILAVFSPVILIIAVAIKLDSKGPVIFVQRRLGLHGREFPMFKFRTMVDNAERMGTGLFSYEDDPRVTKVGAFLRQVSLDELPQLANVLLGHMSLVGPRPPVTYELGDYRDFSDELKSRFVVRPGITGLAQISGRNDLNWDEKLVFDLAYIENFRRRGVVEDIRILVCTAWAVVSMRGIIERE